MLGVFTYQWRFDCLYNRGFKSLTLNEVSRQVKQFLYNL